MNDDVDAARHPASMEPNSAKPRGGAPPSPSPRVNSVLCSHANRRPGTHGRLRAASLNSTSRDTHSQRFDSISPKASPAPTKFLPALPPRATTHGAQHQQPQHRGGCPLVRPDPPPNARIRSQEWVTWYASCEASLVTRFALFQAQEEYDEILGPSLRPLGSTTKVLEPSAPCYYPFVAGG